MKIEEMSPQQRRAEIAELLGRAMVRMQQRVATELSRPQDEEPQTPPLRELTPTGANGGLYE